MARAAVIRPEQSSVLVSREVEGLKEWGLYVEPGTGEQLLKSRLSQYDLDQCEWRTVARFYETPDSIEICLFPYDS